MCVTPTRIEWQAYYPESTPNMRVYVAELAGKARAGGQSAHLARLKPARRVDELTGQAAEVVQCRHGIP